VENNPAEPADCFEQYQNDVLRTMAMGYDRDKALMVFALGLNGEAGEVADIIKKIVGHKHPMDQAGLVDELGDVLWYIAALANQLSIPLATIVQNNVEKLQRRYPQGFSTERSLNREA